MPKSLLDDLAESEKKKQMEKIIEMCLQEM